MPAEFQAMREQQKLEEHAEEIPQYFRRTAVATRFTPAQQTVPVANPSRTQQNSSIGQPAFGGSAVSETKSTGSSPSLNTNGSGSAAQAANIADDPESLRRPPEFTLTPAPASGAKPAGEKKRPSKLSEDKHFKIFSGSANRPLAEEICKFLGVAVGETRLQRFSDGEVHFQLLENVRGSDVFVVQPTCFPVDQNLVELLIMMDALRRASAGRITVVVPYYGYARQDRKDRPRVAITSKLVADLLVDGRSEPGVVCGLARGADSGVLQYPRGSLCLRAPVLVGYFRDLQLAEPDRCQLRMQAAWSERDSSRRSLEVPLAIVDKRRTDINVTEVMNVIGDVRRAGPV